MKRINFLIIVNILFLFNISLADSYYYEADIGQTNGIISRDVMELNLKTGDTTKVLEDVNIPIIMSDMSKVVFRAIPEQKICIYDTETAEVDTVEYLGVCDALMTSRLVPYKSKEGIYINVVEESAGWYNKERRIRERTKILLDKSSYEIIDSTAHHAVNDKSVYSEDGMTNYILKKDGNGIYFVSRDPNTGEIINKRIPIEELSDHDIESFEPGPKKDDKILFWFSTSEGKGYDIYYNPEKREIINKMSGLAELNIITQAITNNGDLVFTNDEVGEIYILEGKTSKLKNRVKLFSNPKKIDYRYYVLIVLNDTLYFLPKDPEHHSVDPPYNFDKRVSADVTEKQSTSSLISMLSQDVDNYTEKDWISSQQTADNLKEKLNQNDMSGFVEILDQEKGNTINEKAYQRLDFNADKIQERRVEPQPVFTLDSLKNNIEKYYQKDWIYNQGAKQSLIAKANKAGKELEKSDTSKAISTLEKFKDKVNKFASGGGNWQEKIDYAQQKMETAMDSIQICISDIDSLNNMIEGGRPEYNQKIREKGSAKRDTIQSLRRQKRKWQRKKRKYMRKKKRGNQQSAKINTKAKEKLLEGANIIIERLQQ